MCGLTGFWTKETMQNAKMNRIITLMSDSISHRGPDQGNIWTDCQVVMHKPIVETTSRTPHIDNPVEIYAGLLYMRKPEDDSKGGNFTIHETTDKITMVNKTLGRQVEDHLHRAVKQVPYKRNVFCMFLNVLDSVHSVTPRIGATERRRSINIIGEFNKTLS